MTPEAFEVFATLTEVAGAQTGWAMEQSFSGMERDIETLTQENSELRSYCAYLERIVFAQSPLGLEV